MIDKVPNSQLLNAGLKAMKQEGKSLKKAQSRGRAMLYQLENGETVRVRTCNDHVLIVVADNPSSNAKLNIEGTDWLLIVMPEVARTPGNVIVYLVPTKVAVEEARKTHNEWLATNPQTKGDNTTWNLWFNETGPEKANGYSKKWAQYRLDEKSSITVAVSSIPSETAVNPIKAEIDAARSRIANIAGVPVEAVRISIDFAA